MVFIKVDEKVTRQQSHCFIKMISCICLWLAIDSWKGGMVWSNHRHIGKVQFFFVLK